MQVSAQRYGWPFDATSGVEEKILEISTGHGGGEHPAELVEKILLDHRVASYPTELIIGDCSHRQHGSLYQCLRRSFNDDDYEPASGIDLRFET